MVNQKPIIILGAGENGEIIKNIFILNKRRKIYFLDDAARNKDTIGPLSDIMKLDNHYDFFVSIGDDHIRSIWYKKLRQLKKTMINAIHPKSLIEDSVNLGSNVMVGACTYININTTVGNNVLINNSCTIEHDNNIGDNVQIAPSVVTGGKVIIKQYSFIGLGSVLKDHIIIEENNIIGAGAVVVDDTEANSLNVGVPSKKIRQLVVKY